MAQEFFTLITEYGLQAIASATAQRKNVNLTHMAVGDGGGKRVVPTGQETALVRERYRGELNSLDVDPLNENQVIAEMIVSETVGGFYAREVAVFDETGNVFAYGNIPETYKPAPSSGSANTLSLRVVLRVENTGAVNLQIDSSVVLATRRYVDELFGVFSVKHDAVAEKANLAELKRKNHELQSVAYLKLANEKALNIVCVGDSMTYGYDTYSTDKIDPAEGHNRTRAPIQYPMQLQSELRRILGNDNTVVHNYGFSGDTAESSFRRAAWRVNPNADIAFLMFGLNDQSKQVTMDKYHEFMAKWIERLLDWGTAVVILISTPRSSGAGSLNDAYRQAAKRVAAIYGCPVVDTTTHIQAYDNAQIYSDVTHFNKEGYRLLGNHVAWALLKNFNTENQSDSFIQLNSSNLITSARFSVVDGDVNHNASGVRVSLVAEQEVHVLVYCQSDNNAVYIDGSFASGATVSFDSDGLPAKPYARQAAGIRTPKTVTLSSINFAGTNLIYVGNLYGRGYHVITIRAAANSWLSGVKLETKAYHQSNDLENNVLFSNEKRFVLMSPMMKTQGALPAPSSDTEIVLPHYVLSELMHPRWFLGGVVKVQIFAARTVSNEQGGVFYSYSEYDVFPIEGGRMGIHAVAEKMMRTSGEVVDEDIVTLVDVSVPRSTFELNNQSKLVLRRNKPCFVKILFNVVDVPAISLGGFLE